MKKIFLPLLIFTSLTVFDVAKAVAQNDIIINEIAWMGNTNSINNEWIELKNTTSNIINLDGWLLKTTDNKIKVYLTGQIPIQGFYLLERTDDDSVPNITADFIYKGALNNSGQSLELYDNANNLINDLAFTLNWPAGDNTTKQTMERTDTGAWQTSDSPNGTPKAKNSSRTIESPPTQKEADVEIKINVESQETPDIKVYPSGVLLNEIIPAPEGSDETNEWIEIYNLNNFTVDISGWSLQDKEGSITIYVFPKETKLQADEYFILKRPETKITLNNDKDTLDLILPNKEIADSISYKNAPKNQSYNKIYPVRNEVSNGAPSDWPTSNASRNDVGWQWSKNLTPGMKNNITINNTTAVLSKSIKVGNNDNVNMATVAIGDTIKITKQSFNPWFLFFIAIAITIISAIIILLLKLKIFKKNVRS
ncbi:MAG: hypothetical protein A3C58_02080 [Candidatus Staskawiczbacteria bacterium RIFCSPHIGHO2_02_FULL_34_10]|uniref:LTD domain-containing protein n=1 Tax=Candidatus Staskawiczbacteria bacterium RIFCSPHIGHO2_02_FULL_34_10 TaxID=1802205 RepID=A0A1G2I0B5_9BACT|nr:MAG: hypothetical protein A3C58_02080 [Candidatus Staskawiczbacteria bacterium RIFCSPHIGHO2_02_FULL_34_10]